MGRLFWKLFLILWLTQIAAGLGVGTAIWLKHRAQAESGPAMEHEPPAPAGHAPPGPPGHSPPRHGPPGFPLEPMLAGLVVSLVVGALLARYLSKPIRLLRQGFEAASRGDLDVRLAPALQGHRDDLSDLGREFDLVAARLKSLMDGQRRLLHDVSHELRSPLARLQAAVDLARQQPEKLDAWLSRIELESERMDRLVGELLTLSRLEAGVPRGAAEKFDLAELLAAVVEDARFEAESRHRRVCLQADSPCWVLGQAELLQRAVENVVRNALRYTAEGSEVRVRLETRDSATGRQLQLCVLDQGPGVPEAELATIFEPFRRGSAARQGEGHGLGLAIARRVIEAHGGSITAANRPEGGLAVCMELPGL